VSDELTYQSSTVDLYEMALLEEPDRSVHLSQQAGDRCFSRTRITQEYEVLAGRNIGKTVFFAPGLNLKEVDLGTDLFFHRLESDK